MMKNILYISLVCVSSVWLSGCMDSEDELRAELLANVDSGEETQVSAGSANFSKYVAVGNSITAGLMDAALYTAGQANSFPNLLSKQMAMAGGGEFNQPDINSVNGYNSSVSDPGNGIILGRFVLDVSIPGPVPVGLGELPGVYSGGPLNNFGVPGARVVDMLTPAYVANPFYARMASNPGNSTILGDAAAANGTFLSIWIGQNDLLGYLTSGGTSEDVTDNPAAILNPSSLTDVTNFTNALGFSVGTLTAGGTKDGVIANLLDATFAPFFRAVPYNAIPLDQATANLLMLGPSGTGADGFAGFNAGLAQLAGLGYITQADADLRTINFTAGANAILIEDDNLLDISVFSPALAGKGKMRQIKANELVLLNAATVLNTTPANFPPTALYGISLPLPDRYTLTTDELTLHASRLSAFNTTIAGVAAANNLALVDVKSLFLNIAVSAFTGGYPIGGQRLQPDFGPNGVFSTDGIHPNPRGQAIIGNAFIDAINAKYGAELKHINVLNLPGVNLL